MQWQNFTELAKFQPKQLEAWKLLKQEDCKYLLYGGAMHGGKSYFLRWASIGLALMFFKETRASGIPIGLFSEDYPTLRDRQISRIKQEFPQWLGQLKSTEAEGLCFFIAPEYGAGRILLRNLDDPSKYQSSEFAAILVEELTKNTEQTFTDLRTRLRFPGLSNPKFIGATNPGGIGHVWCQRHWIKRNSGDKEQLMFKYIPANLNDNKFTTESYRNQIDALPERLRRAYRDGDWDAFEGQFFYTFNPTDQLIEPFKIPKEWTLFGSIDPGWGGWGSFGLQARDFTGKIFRVGTLYEKEKSPQERAESAIKFIEGNKFTDGRMPSMIVSGHDAWARKDRFAVMTTERTFADVFGANGLYLTKATIDRHNGWGAMRSVMPKNYFIFKYHNAKLVEQLSQTITDEHDAEDIQGRGNDQRVEDHALDEARYGLMAMWTPSEPKEEVKIVTQADYVTHKIFPQIIKNSEKKKRH